jgi:hypothetical protein
MKRHHLILIAAAVAITIYAGCSEDSFLGGQQETYTSGMPSSEAFSIVGPTEIVMCIDVSDSVSASELQMTVNALKGTLSDPAIVPQDGNVTLSARSLYRSIPRL